MLSDGVLLAVLVVDHAFASGDGDSADNVTGAVDGGVRDVDDFIDASNHTHDVDGETHGGEQHDGHHNTAARDAGTLCCYLPRLAQAAPYWPQREALCQTALQFLDRADVLFLEESDLLLLFGSRELRTALFALFTGHVQLIFFYKKDRILAFTRSVMASAAKKDQSPALVLYRMEQMGIHVIDLPRLREHVLGQLLSNDANTTECQGLPY